MNEHLAVPFDATPEGAPATYRCVRCKSHWPAVATPPATCTARPPQARTPLTGSHA